MAKVGGINFFRATPETDAIILLVRGNGYVVHDTCLEQIRPKYQAFTDSAEPTKTTPSWSVRKLVRSWLIVMQLFRTDTELGLYCI